MGTPLRIFRARLAFAALLLVLLLVAVFATGTAWYALVEGWTLLDSAFMAMQTMTTVGYGQVRPLDTSGRVFTIVYIPIGVGAVFYFVGLMVEDLLIHQVAEVYGLRRLNRRIARMRDHIVICGFGRVGREVADELASRDEPVLVIDLGPGAARRSPRARLRRAAGRRHRGGCAA